MNNNYRTSAMALCVAFLALVGTTPAAASPIELTPLGYDSELGAESSAGASQGDLIHYGSLCRPDGNNPTDDNAPQLYIFSGSMEKSESKTFLRFLFKGGGACGDSDGDACDGNDQLKMTCILLGDPGQTVSQCSPGAFTCAQSAAHAEYEEVSGMPNVYSHITGGHGMNPNGLSAGATDITTTLGSHKCSFQAGGGCGATWSDVASHCKAPLMARTVVTTLGGFSQATAVDPSCE